MRSSCCCTAADDGIASARSLERQVDALQHAVQQLLFEREASASDSCGVSGQRGSLRRPVRRGSAAPPAAASAAPARPATRAPSVSVGTKRGGVRGAAIRRASRRRSWRCDRIAAVRVVLPALAAGCGRPRRSLTISIRRSKRSKPRAPAAPRLTSTCWCGSARAPAVGQHHRRARAATCGVAVARGNAAMNSSGAKVHSAASSASQRRRRRPTTTTRAPLRRRPCAAAGRRSPPCRAR